MTVPEASPPRGHKGQPDVADRKRVGAALRRTRLQRGITAKGLAAQVGATPTSLSNLEAGKTGMSMALMFRLARALDCTWNDILGPPPTLADKADPEWQSGYRAGVSDALSSVRDLLDNGR